MLRSLKTKMAFFFAILLIVPIAVFVWTMNLGINRSFDTFANQQQQQLLQQIKSQILDLYQPETASFNADGLEAVGNAALQNGVILHLQTTSSELDWDIATHKAQECQLMLQHREQNLHSRYPTLDGGYQQSVFELAFDQQAIGTLTLGYYGPYSLDDIAVTFISGMNRQMIAIAVLLLLAAIIAGTILGWSFSKPVQKASETAQQISDGDYGVQLPGHYRTTELIQLQTSINTMSRTLKLKEQQKRRLTADVAHELRTPLSNLQAHIEAVIDGVWEPTPEFYQSCHAEILRLARLVDQLGTLTSYEEKQFTLQLQPFRIIDFYKNLQVLYALSAKEKGVTLQIDCEKADATCVADSMRMQECIGNLLSNAIRYTQSGGLVILRYRETPEQSCFSVTDSGTGIPPEDVPHIFERFYRVDPSRNAKTGGQGIGLAIAKAIAQAHGGTITVESQLGVGTTFFVFLPKIQSEV